MKMIQHILRLLFAILVLLIFNQRLYAQEKPVGSVVALRGMVTAVKLSGVARRLAV